MSSCRALARAPGLLGRFSCCPLLLVYLALLLLGLRYAEAWGWLERI